MTPCPHCGEPLDLEPRRSSIDLTWRVHCGACGAQGPTGRTRTDAEARWDDRHVEEVKP